MTNPSASPTGDGGNGAAKSTPVDDDSDSTPLGSSVVKTNDNKEVGKTWRIRFISNSNAEKVHPSKIHLQLIQEVQERFGGKVKVLSNNNVLMPKVDILTWTEERHSSISKFILKMASHARYDSNLHRIWTVEPARASLFIEYVPAFPFKRSNRFRRSTSCSRTTGVMLMNIAGQRMCGTQFKSGFPGFESTVL